jgi:hypothetical protein
MGLVRRGIGEEVAGILVPEASASYPQGNANSFGPKVTQIVASRLDDLPGGP